MKISVISPVKNEAQFIGYSVMSVLPYIHEIIYNVARGTDDGTVEILEHIQKKYDADGKIKWFFGDDFNVHDMPAYNKAFNDCIERSTGDAVWFLHPDMVVTTPEAITAIKDGPMAWFTNLDSYARDMDTVITKGRATRWKNIHVKRMGLHYFGGYGSQNEDFYHKAITGDSHLHHGETFSAYPFRVGDSGIRVNHYCELKPYKRRREKMVNCLKTLYPGSQDIAMQEMAALHPRVTLEQSTSIFGQFNFEKKETSVPDVFKKYKEEFDNVTKK
mgnify:CR=1 FL=1